MGALVSPAAGASTASFNAPVYAGDFPDPSIIVTGGTYWAYSTGSAGRNLQVMSSVDLHTWSVPLDPLPVLPSWASSGRTWAPGVIRIGPAYVMYYTVHDAVMNQQCISVATATTPGGPFSDVSAAPLICQIANGGSIDPNPYVDPVSGAVVLVWKSDDNALGVGHPTHLWGQPLRSDGLALASGTSPALLLTMSAPWQSPSMEGPTVVRAGRQYVLFYSANNYDTATSGIGYATSPSLLGPYTNRSVYSPWLGTRGNAKGAQGPWVFTDPDGALRLAFAAWYGAAGYENGGARSLWTASLTFNRQGTPSLT
jgi:beta-xylosidase